MSAASAAARPAAILPELDRLWVRYAPGRAARRRAAPPGELRWLDLAAGELGSAGPVDGEGAAYELPDGPFDDVLYLPPVGESFAGARVVAAREHAARGTPVLVQILPGDPVPDALLTDGIVLGLDLLAPLLRGDPDALLAHFGGAGESAMVLWPLIPGITDRLDLVEEGCRRLAAAGARTVQGIAPALPPVHRRELFERATAGEDAVGGVGEGAEAGEDDEDGGALFQALFHGPGADPRAFARVAHRHGLRPFLPRPLPRPPLSGAPEREVAGLLATAGELCFRLGQVGRGQAHLRAARWIDRSGYDLRSLAREGNLAVLHWLGDESRRIVEEWAEAGESSAVEALVHEYLGPAREPAGVR